MATIFSVSHPSAEFGAPGNEAAVAGKPNLFRRIFDALIEARQRQADRVIAEILARRGGVMADSGAPPPARQYRPGRLPALRMG